ncbi:hypothetical protein CDAR_24411 [Caerostris darwini]|uniref:Uncharacterized protein n=1 Tax=Caerostris darwini TaxID=1538125 RepID=A0AAV4QGC9_9ARAC|nr:hypothetical protein CDAR_24411 [Caerostris darwini]
MTRVLAKWSLLANSSICRSMRFIVHECDPFPLRRLHRYSCILHVPYFRISPTSFLTQATNVLVNKLKSPSSRIQFRLQELTEEYLDRCHL